MGCWTPPERAIACFGVARHAELIESLAACALRADATSIARRSGECPESNTTRQPESRAAVRCRTSRFALPRGGFGMPPARLSGTDTTARTGASRRRSTALTPCSHQACKMPMGTAADGPAASSPMKTQFLRPFATRRNARSAPLSMMSSVRPSSRYLVHATLFPKVCAIAFPMRLIGASVVGLTSNHCRISSNTRTACSSRSARRCCGNIPHALVSTRNDDEDSIENCLLSWFDVDFASSNCRTTWLKWPSSLRSVGGAPEQAVVSGVHVTLRVAAELPEDLQKASARAVHLEVADHVAGPTAPDPHGPSRARATG